MTRRRTAWLLVGGRFVAVGRAAIPILAAQARVPFARFAAWTAVGTALWGAWLLGLAVAFGRGAEALFPRGLGAGLGLAVLAVVLVAFAVRALRRRGRRAPDRPRRRELCA
jgi:membrane protein DedA with SNARE-associated domain